MCFPDEERHPTEDHKADERPKTCRTSLPEPVVGSEETTIGFLDTRKVLREGVEDDVVDDDRENKRNAKWTG